MSKERKEGMQGSLGPNQRWSVRRKREVVLRQGEFTATVLPSR